MMAANINSSTQAITPPVSTVSSVPVQNYSNPSQDIGLSILAFVQTLDLAATSCVNRSWRDLTNDNQVWTDRLSQDERDNFAALVREKYLSWKEACLYTPLSHFVCDVLARILKEKIYSSTNWGRKYLNEIPPPTTVVNDLVFTFLPPKKLTVEDLRSGAEEILLEDQSQNIHDIEIEAIEYEAIAAYKADLLKKFIERVKRKPSSYPRLAKTFRSILKSEFFRFLRELIESVCIVIISGLIIIIISACIIFLQKKLAAKQ